MLVNQWAIRQTMCKLINFPDQVIVCFFLCSRILKSLNVLEVSENMKQYRSKT